MSGVTLTWCELIYANTADGTALANSNTATNIEPTTQTAPALPVAFWHVPASGVGKSLRMVARGVYSTPASNTTTLTLALAIGPTPTVLVTAPAILNGISSITNGFWEWECEVIARAVGSAGSLHAAGVLTVQTSATTTVALSQFACPANTAAGSWAVAYATTNTTPDGVHLRGTWSAATAGTSVTCTQFLLYGLN